MDKVFKLLFDIHLITEISKAFIRRGQQVDIVFVDDDEDLICCIEQSNDENLISCIDESNGNFADCLLSNTHNPEIIEIDEFILTKLPDDIDEKFIYTTILNRCKEALNTFNDHEKLPSKRLEKAFWKWTAMPAEGADLYETDDFVRITYPKTLNRSLEYSEHSRDFQFYWDHGTCGYCDYTTHEATEAANAFDTFERDWCKCKEKYIEDCNYDYQFMSTYKKRLEKIVVWTKLRLEINYGIDELEFTTTSKVDNPKTINDTENKYVRIFSSPFAYTLFLTFYQRFGNTRINKANYSFVFYMMQKDELIICGNTEFIAFLANKEFDITIDRTDSKQKQYIYPRDDKYLNKKLNDYNETKTYLTNTDKGANNSSFTIPK